MYLEYMERLIRSSWECPTHFYDNNIILASFPKSGNTWFRFVSSNVISLTLGKNEIDFHKIKIYSPEIRGNRKLKGLIQSTTAPNFLKTHFYYGAGFKKYPSLVLFREPTKTMLSYYDYMKNEHSKTYLSFGDFLKRSRVGLDAYNLFHDTWLEKGTLFVSYDELIKNQFTGLKKIYEQLGYPISDEILTQAIENSSRKNMARLEREKGDPTKVSKNYQFVGLKSDRHDSEGHEGDFQFITEKTNSIYEKMMNRRLKF